MEESDGKGNKSGQRLIALDAFRGFTIAAMIIVNDPGSWEHLYAPMAHAKWNGITPTDFIFPFFLFIVGISIVLSHSKKLEAGVAKSTMIAAIIKRSAIIFGLGIFLNLFPDFNFLELRVPGVLQRIALVFLFCALLFLHSDWKTQARIGSAILLCYWILMTFIPVPGEGVAIMEPGRNWAAWLDGIIVPGKLYQGTWDPEGVLSTFPALVSGICGMLAGHILKSNSPEIETKVLWLSIGGFIALAAGEFWGWFFPLNKNLWTSSYVLYTSGLGSLFLAVSIWLIDVKKNTNWAKFGIIYGSNAITVYTLSGILPHFTAPAQSLFFNDLVKAGLDAKFVSFLWAVIFCLTCYIPAVLLYRQRIFIKV